MSDYVFEDDSASVEEYLEELKKDDRKDKKSSQTNDDRIGFFVLKEGESADLRLVQVPGNKTFLRQLTHYVGKVSMKSIVIPKKVPYITCAETDGCLGDLIEKKIHDEKIKHEFKSPENERLFKMQGMVQPTKVLNMLGIDRRDGKLKLFQANKLTGEDILSLALDKENAGNPAHPTEGYDIKVTRKDKKTYSVKQLKTKKLTADEIKMVQEVKDPFGYVRSKGTLEFHARLGIEFKDDAEEAAETTPEAKEMDIVLPSKELALEVPLDTPEDDIPF